MLLMEFMLTIHEFELPSWFFPFFTPYDMISTAHRLFPAYMNACRCVTGAFYVDARKQTVDALETLISANRDVTLKASTLVRSYQEYGSSPSTLSLDGFAEVNGSKGLMSSLLHEIKLTVSTSNDYSSGSMFTILHKKVALINDPNALLRLNKEPTAELYWLRNLVIYLLVRFVFIKSKEL